jgi:hypothetical protein
MTGGRGWRARAVCVDVDPELFFPVGESGLAIETQVRAAKAVCAPCPVRAECLADALAGMAYGIAGGLTAEERRGLGAGRTVSVLAGPPVAGTLRETARAGRAAIRAGRPMAEVAREFGVSTRTVQRWAAQVAGAGVRGAA